MADKLETDFGLTPTTADTELTNQKKSTFRKPIFWLQSVVFLLGIGLLAFVVYKIGFKTLVETVSRIGWGFLIIIALNGLRHFLRAFCIYIAIPSEHRTLSYTSALSARLGGEAVSFITFTGPFLGEATKAALLKRNMPLAHSGAAVVVDNILYYTSVIVMMLAGVALMSLTFRTGNSMKTALEIVAVLSVISFIGLLLLVRFRVKPVGFVIRRLIRKNLAPQLLHRKLPSINNLESNVYEFYSKRRAIFFTIIGLNFLAHAISVIEVYSALTLLGFETTFAVSFIIESLTKVINFAFSFIPGAVGVYEGGNGIILHALGYATATGVALALVRRGSIFFWTLCGLCVLLWRTTNRLGKKDAGKTE